MSRTVAKRKRSDLVDRVLELRPVMKRHFSGAPNREMREELHSVTLHQLSALGELRGGPLTMSELAKVLAVSESSATAVGDRLVRQGLAERESDPSDRRVVLLALSDAGRGLVERLHESACNKTAAMLTVLSDEQLEQLVDILDTLASAEAATKDLGGVTL